MKRIKHPTTGLLRRLGAHAILSLGALVAFPMAAHAAGNAPQPDVCTRSCWSARPNQKAVGEMSALDRAILHHTAGTYSTSLSQSKDVARTIQNYHMDQLGWADIGYHYLVDSKGNILEGRVRSHNKSYRPKGAHDNTNINSFGFTTMGNYQSHTFTSASRGALQDIIAWRMPTGWSPYGSSSYGSFSNIGRVDFHRSVRSTACPGDNIVNSVTYNFNGGSFRDGIAARIDGSGGDDRLDIVVRGSSNRIYKRTFWRNNGGWYSWGSLSGAAQEKPAIASRGAGHLAVFIRGGGNDINLREFRNGRWDDNWRTLGGPIASGIGAVSRHPDRINIVARGTDNTIQHKWWTPNGWSVFQSLGGSTNATPTISARDANTLDVFIRGKSNNALQHRYWKADTGWSPGFSTINSTTLYSGPSSVSRSSNRINIVARGSGSRVFHIYWASGSGWSGWQNLGGETIYGPGIASWGSDRLDAFLRGTGGDVKHRYWRSGVGWSSNWSTLGRSDASSGPEAVGTQW